MASVKFLNPKAGSPPYKSFFSNVAIVPPNTSIAYISTQWAADPTTGELAEGVAGDYGKQSKFIWENIVGILKELGAEMKDIIHKNVYFQEFNDDIGKECVMAQLSALPDEWKPFALTSALSYNGVSHFHRPGIVLAVDLTVAVPSQ